MIRAFLLGLLASLFFAVTFVLNRQMGVVGGHWIWTASMRFFYMLPMLFLLLLPGRRYLRVMAEIRKNTVGWLLWSTVGFGVFYLFICLASTYGPSWLIAAAWQMTIIAGVLLTPLLYGRSGTRRGLPARQLVTAMVIVLGVLLVQLRYAATSNAGSAILGFVFSLVAAFAYPLGNRTMMQLTGGRINTLERLFGMTLCSMPFWIALSAVGLAMGIHPTASQYEQTFVVALFAGIVATLLFFRATDMVRDDPGHLAVVESTQSGELVFALLGGVLVYHDMPPDAAGFVGLAIVVLGLVMNSLSPVRRPS
jgi:drug/metabolite transporter (DMT)-like permease